MTFAQHCIAGEVGVRPRVLNKKLILARQITQHKSCCMDLGRNGREALFAILAFVREKNPRHDVYCRRESLLQECCITSERTLFRALAELEDKDYIVRKQARRRGGKFTVSRIRLTEKAILILELENEATAYLFNKKNASKLSLADSKNTSISHPSSLNCPAISEPNLDIANSTTDGFFHKQPSANLAHVYKEHTKENKHSLQRTLSSPSKSVDNPIDRTTRLPVRLLPLVELGITPKGVSRLMREAKHYGKRLEDVMKVIWKYISTLKGSVVYSYLHACLRSEQDFSFISKQRENELVSQTKVDAAKRKLSSLDHRHHGFSILDDKGALFGVFDAAIKMIRVGDRVMPLNIKLGMALLEGKLRLVRSI